MRINPPPHNYATDYYPSKNPRSAPGYKHNRFGISVRKSVCIVFVFSQSCPFFRTLTMRRILANKTGKSREKMPNEKPTKPYATSRALENFAVWLVRVFSRFLFFVFLARRKSWKFVMGSGENVFPDVTSKVAKVFRKTR